MEYDTAKFSFCYKKINFYISVNWKSHSSEITDTNNTRAKYEDENHKSKNYQPGKQVWQLKTDIRTKETRLLVAQ